MIAVGSRVSWRVRQGCPPHALFKTFSGVVVKLVADPMVGCPRCICCGEPGAYVRPDGKHYVGWHPIRLLEEVA